MRSFFLVIFWVAGFTALLLASTFIKRKVLVKQRAKRRQKRLVYLNKKRRERFQRRIKELIERDWFWIEIYRRDQPGNRLTLIKERPNDPIQIRFGPSWPNEEGVNDGLFNKAVTRLQVPELIYSCFGEEVTGLIIKTF